MKWLSRIVVILGGGTFYGFFFWYVPFTNRGSMNPIILILILHAIIGAIIGFALAVVHIVEEGW